MTNINSIRKSDNAMKTLFICFATLFTSSLSAQILLYDEGYKFDVESGFYYNNDNIDDVVIVNHRDSLNDYIMEWQPDTVLLSSLLVRDGNNLAEVAAFAADCGIEVQAIGATPEEMLIIISETDCNYEFRRLDDLAAPLTIPNEEFTAVHVFLDGTNRDASAALITSGNSIQRANGTDKYVLLTGHTRDTLGFLDIDSVYTPIDLQYDESGYIIAVDENGEMSWHYENESKTSLSFIRTVAYIDGKVYVAHHQIFKTDILVFSEEGELLEEYTWDGVTVYNITSDEENNIYLSGHYDQDLGNGNISFGSEEVLLPEAEAIDAFIAKYDSDLNFLWAQTITGDNIDTGVSCDVDDNGDVWLIGCIQKDGVFDKGGPSEVTFTASGLEDVFVAKYSFDGRLLYANTMGGSSADIGLKVVAENNDLKLWGLFRNTIDLSLDEDISYLFTDENDDVDESYFFVTYADFTITSTEEPTLSEAGVSLYPNPASDLLHIVQDDKLTPTAYALISDLSGKTVAHYKVVPRTVDTSTLSESIYTLQIYDDSGLVQSERFVVAR